MIIETRQAQAPELLGYPRGLAVLACLEVWGCVAF